MPNLSQLKRDRMLAFLQKIKDEHRDDDEMLIALGEIESELTAKKYGLVWEQHEKPDDWGGVKILQVGPRASK